MTHYKCNHLFKNRNSFIIFYIINVYLYVFIILFIFLIHEVNGCFFIFSS